MNDAVEKDSKEFRVLVVEDDELFIRLLQIRLKSWKPNVAVDIAQSLVEAERLLSIPSRHYELVILDQMLPDGMGSELFGHPRLQFTAVLAVSADPSPIIPGAAIEAGAQHFLGKKQVSEPLFIPLINAIIQRKKIEEQLIKARIEESRLSTIKVLLSTLRHEINNPLGAVLGGAYLIRARGGLESDQQDPLRLIEESSHRIRHVIEQLCEAAQLEEVTKGQERVFHVPGDTPWEEQTRLAHERALERRRLTQDTEEDD